MNWAAIGAIGELVGAAAVLVTLIYFAIQIRGLSADSYAALLARLDEGERDLRRANIEHTDLILKANNRDELNDAERFKLHELYRAHQAFHFFAFMRARTYGDDGSLPATIFADFLRHYPCFLALYRISDLRLGKGEPREAMTKLVDRELTESGDNA